MSKRPLGGGVGVGWGGTARSLCLGVLAVVVVAAFLATTASSALAARGHEYEPALKIGTPCTVGPCAPGELKEPSAVAVNEASGEVYVLDQGNARVQRFDGRTGAFLGGFDGSATPAGSFEFPATPQNGALAIDNSCALHQPPLTGSACETFDPSNGDLYVADYGHEAIYKFSPSGAFLGQLINKCPLEGTSCIPGEGVPFAREIRGVAVDPSGRVWIYLDERTFTRYSAAAPNLLEARTREFSNAEGFAASGFAVDAAGEFYVRMEDGATHWIAKVGSAGNFLSPKVDPEDSSAVGVDQSTATAFLDNVTSVAAFGPDGTELERLGFDGELQEGGGIGIDAATGFAYVADRDADHLLVMSPTQPGPPTVEVTNQFVSAVTSVGAELHSEVNPRSEEGEGPTTYHFEYGPCPSLDACPTTYELSTTPATLAPDFQIHPVSAALSGLAPGTVYHFRLVAENSHSTGPTLGAESTFSTQPTGALLLPDSRQWELASSPDKLGARIAPISESGVIQAAANGSGITYLASTPTGPEPPGYANQEQLLSARSASGWSTRDIGIPHSSATGKTIGPGPEYKFFSANLSLGAVQPFGPFDPGLSSEGSESTAYLHELHVSCGSSCFRPFVTGASGFANVPDGTHFGEGESCQPKREEAADITCGPAFLGASADLGHVVLSANVALTPGGGPGLYEWSGGALTAVSVLPGGEAAGGGLGLEDQAARGAISSDGSRIFWTGGSPKSLYLRYLATEAQSAIAAGQCTEPTKACTLQLDAKEPGCATCESGAGHFQIASADGSRVFFTDEHRLTEDSGATSGSPDLFECHIVSAGEALGCDLSDLTPKQGEEGAAVKGGVLGAGEDGGTVYFVAGGLQSEAPNSLGRSPVARKPNLYLRRAGTTEFLATLAAGDEQDWSERLNGQPTRVSPNGRFLEFMSEGSPTGYDNRDRASGRPVAEVYLYDAQTKRLRCASCEPSGARPVGVEYFKLEPGSGGLVGGPRGVWQTTGLVAANVPGWTANASAPLVDRYQPRYLSDTGRLFFNSGDALVHQDSNGTQDVYEFEPAGVGGCTETLPTFSQQNGGCVSLISSGTSREESAFMDASESGDDVFLLTSSRLAPQDVDSALDVYDAHVCSAASPCLPSPPAPAPACEGDACQQPATPPSDQTPGSLSFSGAGNVLECSKGKVKKSGRCVAKKQKKAKHKKSHKKHAKSKRGSR